MILEFLVARVSKRKALSAPAPQLQNISYKNANPRGLRRGDSR
jgi:hypothetical protein